MIYLIRIFLIITFPFAFMGHFLSFLQKALKETIDDFIYLWRNK